MAKISELPPITGANTRPEDLFVIVNLVQGDDGTSNITRKELVEAIQYEIFSRINITGGTISGVVMSDSRLNNVEIDNSEIEDTDFIRGSIDDTVITNSTANNITMTYSSFQFGTLLDSSANNLTITSSDFSQGTGNNNVLTNTTLLDGSANNFVITDSTANNIIITNSELNDSTANNVAITDSTVNNTIITSSEFNDGTANNVAITQSDFSDGTINQSVIETSEFNNGTMETVTGINLDISNSAYANGTVSDSILTDNTILNGTANNIAITDSTANNTIITNSEFNDGTGNNVTLTNSTIDDSLFSDGTISNTSFTGTMDSVVATNIQIRSSTADGLGANNSTFENGGISGSTFDGGVINKSNLVDFDMDINTEFEAPMDDESYFAIRNEKTGDTEQINFGQLFDEVSKKTAQALKVHVDAGSGDDKNPGTQLQPVRTLEKAFELCLEKAGGELNRNAINNSVHISVGPGTYYTKGNLQLPDDCSITSTSGQYATVIELEKGYENNNGILVGSGCYAQGFAYQNFQVDNFDFPEGGFAVAYRPGAKLLRSPYLRDSSQLSNFLRADVEPPLNPYNSKGTLADLGREFTLSNISDPTKFAIDDEIEFSSGAIGYVSYISEIASDSKIHVRNLKNNQGFAVGDTITAESGGTAVIQEIGIDDFPNREVGRGGGCVLADRRVLDTDSLYTYVLCFGFTPRSQNGIGYVARDGAGVNGIGSLSIFVRCAFYALNGGQMTLNNSGTQFGDISMRAKGTTEFFAPKSTTATIIGNTAFADTVDNAADDIIDDVVEYLTANTANGGLGYQAYDSEKCLRDSGIVLDGTGYDVALDTNYWGRLGGITYRSPISYVVPGEQLEETKGALEYLRDRTKEIFVTGNSEVNERVEASFGELLNVLEYGEENINPIIWQDTSVPRTAARNLIQDNREFITGELIDWIENNDEFYAYDSKACRRDVSDYILPAVKNDMQFDTNYNAVTAGRAYYMAAAKTVIENQNNETVEAYRRLKDQTNELLDGDSYTASAKTDAAFDEILSILENKGKQFTPTAATYDPETGKSVITLGTGHGLTVGRYVLLKTGGLIFTCDRDNHTTRTGYPRASDPAAGTPVEIIGANETKITVNVGKSAIVDVHKFVEALPNSVSVLGSAIAWSDSSSIPADKRNARKQLEANREFLQDLVLGYIDNNYFRYDSNKCRRDIQDYILPAVERDILTGSNYNAYQTGIAYRSGTTLADNVINEQLVETTGAINELKTRVNTDEIGSQFTPTNATYDPVTGRFEATIGIHSLQPGDYVRFLEDGITFSCDTGSGPTNDAVPNPGHPFYNHPCPVHSVTPTTIVCYVGTGGTNDHTFVSALTNAISHVIGISDKASEHRSDEAFDKIIGILNSANKTYDTSSANYDTVTGLTEITIGAHDLQVGDEVMIAADSMTFTCATDGNATQHTYPTTTITSFTPSTATYVPETGEFTANIGPHKLKVGDEIEFAPRGITFTCELDGNVTEHSAPEPHHPFWDKKVKLTSVEGNVIGCNVGAVANGGGVHTFVSAITNAIKGERQHPAYKKPVVVAATTATTFTVNVGTSTDTSVHTFVSATAGNIKTAKHISTYTPYDATYDPATGVFVASIGKHNLEAGDYVMIKPNSVIFTCDLDGNVTEHAAPQSHHPAYRTPVKLDSVTTDTITMNIGTGTGGAHTFVRATQGAIDSDALVFTDPASYVSHYTPTTATYDPVTGISVITIPGHDLTTNDYIEFAPYSFTYTCAQDSNATEHSYPRKGDSNYRTPMAITNVAGDDITVQLAASSGGAHTFVSVIKDAVSKVTYNSQGQYAREQLQKNKEFLAKEVSSYLESNYFVFDGNKCSRDTGYILDAVRRDVATGSNYHTVFTGLGYQIGTKGSNEVITEQLTETVAAINYMKAKVAADVNVTGTALTRANAAFDEIIDIMQNGSGNANVLGYGSAAAVPNGVDATDALITNRTFLQKEVTAYIAQNFPTVSYNVAKCERDTGYLVDAIVWDVRFGSNAAAINFARLYYENAISVLPEDQKLPTAKTWEHLAEVCYKIARKETVTPTTGNGEAFTAIASDAGIEIANAIRNGVNVTTQIIRDDDLKSLPTLNEGEVETAMIAAVNAIDGLTENLQESVIKYLKDEHNGLPFSKAVCERDVGIIIDAVSRDIEYGGNENTVEVFEYYFKRFNATSADYEQLRSTNVLPIEVKGQFKTLSDYEDTANVSGLREAINVLPYEQREPTREAFNHLADMAEKIVKEVAHTSTYTSYTPTNATYDPATGVFVATIGAHNFVKGDTIYLKPNGITFSCNMGSGAANHTSPQPHHPYYQKAITLTDTDATTITMNVGTGGSGQYPHTFVSALADSISEGPYQDVDGTAADATTGTAVHDLIATVANLIDDTNIEDDEMPVITKASFDPNRTLARKQLQRNRDFIIEEVQGYLKDRYYVFDGDKCKRDIGFLLDAVAVDVLTGSNYNAVFNGVAYRIGTVGADAVINEQLTETVSAIKYAQGLAVAAVTDSTMKTKVNEAFAEIIDVMTNGRAAADTIDYTSVAPSFNRLNARSQLQNNRTFLIAEMTAWLAANRPSLTYDVAKCERDTGYLIDAVSHDAQFGGNFATLNDAKLYFENAVIQLPEEQRQPTADAFKHLGDCAELICLDQDIGGLKSAGNGETQDRTAGGAGAGISASIEGLFDIVAGSIENNTTLLNPAQELPDATSFNAVNSTAFAQVQGVIPTVQSGVLGHLATYFEILPYSETKCRRDTGYIIDAVAHDIQYGGNAATVQTAGMYFENAVNTGLQIEQRMGTRDAFLHMAKIIEHVVGAKSITTTLFPRVKKYYTGDILTQYDYWNGIHSYQSVEAQDMAVHGANPDTSIAARKLVEIIANAVDDNVEVRNTIPDRIDVDQTWMGANYITSKELVESQSDVYSEAVISYLTTTHNGLSFRDAKCRRDIGYLIDSAMHDVQHDTNFAMRQSAGIYFENGVSVLPVDARIATADIYEFLGDAAKQVVEGVAVTNASTYTLMPQDTTTHTAATTAEGDRVHELIEYVEDVIRANDVDELPGPEFTASWVPAELTTAAQTIVDNTEELASDVTNHINTNFNVLDYSKAKCRRDTGYLLDAFSFDLNFGGNTASRWNADFYFWNSVYRLPEDQRIPTAKAYRQLGRICKDIVLGEYKGQTTIGEVGTSVESLKVEMLANIFYKTQLYNDTKYLPVKEEPDYTYSDAVFTNAQNIIEQRRKQLQKDTVRFVNAAYDFIDINLTRRDARNLLTALQNDFKYEDLQVPVPSYTTNGNQNAVRTYTASFFNYDGTHVFPVFNPSDPTLGLKYKGSVNDVADLGSLTGMKPNWAYIVATDYATNYYAGDIYYWNGIQFVNAGANNTDLLDAFVGSWDRMRTYIVNNLSPDSDHSLMIEGLFDDCLKDNILRPNTLVFGSLVESIAHQFNGASAGVNRNALPLNFRNLGAAISAIASVLNEDGGRIRWSGADELNNQYFARGLRINGRTGRIEGRPFTSSVRKLARRASNSRAVV